jgi:hypothetical protein
MSITDSKVSPSLDPGILDPAKDDIGMLDIIKINTMLKIKIFDLIMITPLKSFEDDNLGPD